MCDKYVNCLINLLAMEKRQQKVVSAKIGTKFFLTKIYYFMTLLHMTIIDNFAVNNELSANLPTLDTMNMPNVNYTSSIINTFTHLLV